MYLSPLRHLYWVAPQFEFPLPTPARTFVLGSLPSAHAPEADLRADARIGCPEWNATFSIGSACDAHAFEKSVIYHLTPQRPTRRLLQHYRGLDKGR
jgi:hypothetical protein